MLDTRQGDPSEKLYVSVGWRPAGVIPRYAESAGRALDARAFYYRLLDGSASRSPFDGRGESMKEVRA